jgi:hypothetical protein
MPDVYPRYIFGVHDRGGEHLMRDKGKRGWVLVTEEIYADPNNHSGSNYTDLTNQGFGVIVRLNYGYGDNGTIPYSSEYDNFARRCGNFVQASPGCHIWIIGNEMNLSAERPRPPKWPEEQVITAELYASCFRKCRAEIRRRPDHGDDQVVIGAVGPYNPETGDYIEYFAKILELLGSQVDGISLHAYTHGQDPALVFSEQKMNPPFHNYNLHFRTYRDFLAVVPASLRDRPVYITESNQYAAWRDGNTGWMRNAYREINDWNQNPNNQPIQALLPFRWKIENDQDPKQVGWAITNKPGVQGDFRDAMNNEYRVVLPNSKPEYRVAWLEVGTPGRMDRGAQVAFSVQVRNDGRATWANSGSAAIRLGHRWIDAAGTTIEGPRSGLPLSVAAGQTVTLPQVIVQAPEVPGSYTLELDLVEGVSGWFTDLGSTAKRVENIRVGDRYRVAWLSVPAPSEGNAGETVTFPVALRNEGALTWPSDGNHPVNLTYKWLDAARQVVVADGLRTPIGQEVEPLEEITFNAKVQFPSQPGAYILQMDMVHEMVTWFHWKGSVPHETEVEAKPALPDYAAEWLDYDGPQRLIVGQRGSVLMRVKNVGQLPWPHSGADAVRLGYRWLDAEDRLVHVDGVSSWPLSQTIEPGQAATFRDVELVPPGVPGTYRLVWDLVQAGTWLSSQGVAIKEMPFQIAALEYGVAWQALKPWPARMLPGAEQQTSLRLRNTGTKEWAAAGDHPVHLAYHWFTEEGKLSEPWDTFRIRLPQDVDPEASVDLIGVVFKTPSVVGRYTLRWDLVEEGQAWFFRQGGAPWEITVEVSDQAVFVPWTAQASHNAAGVGLAFDGNPATAWDSLAVQEPGMWFEVDLGEVLVLDRVKAASPGSGFPVGYQIKLSADGQDWHLVAEQEKNWEDIGVAFAPCQARYLRLEQTGQPSWPATWKISEIAVSTTQPWAGAKASHYSDDAHEAIDAHLRTAWNTRAVKQKPGMWFELDMGNPRQIERVMLVHPPSQQPRGYVVQVSADGHDWQEVGRKGDNWGTLDIGFQPVAARHIRVETINSSPYHPWGVAEVVVWRSSPGWLRGRES